MLANVSKVAEWKRWDWFVCEEIGLSAEIHAGQPPNPDICTIPLANCKIQQSIPHHHNPNSTNSVFNAPPFQLLLFASSTPNLAPPEITNQDQNIFGLLCSCQLVGRALSRPISFSVMPWIPLSRHPMCGDMPRQVGSMLYLNTNSLPPLSQVLPSQGANMNDQRWNMAEDVPIAS